MTLQDELATFYKRSGFGEVVGGETANRPGIHGLHAGAIAQYRDQETLS